MMEGVTLQKSDLVTQTIESVMNSSFFLPNYDIAPVSVLCAFIGLSTIVLLVALPLNVYVLRLILIGTSNGVASEFFSLNLCVCEIIICLSSVPSVFNVICYRNDAQSPLYLFLLLLSILHSISRPCFQCCVCVERYVAVIHPVIFLRYKPLTYRITWSTVTWIIVLGFSVLSLFVPYRCVFYYILLPEYLLVFSIKILCSVAVLKALRKPGPGEKLHVKDVESNRMKKKAFCLIVISLFFMVITYCPILVFIFVYDSLLETQRWIGLTLYYYLMIVAGFVHPFLYLHRVGKLPFIPDLMILLKLQ
ncbi:G-protein coupled receptor 4-like [Hemibagrus wyckioides]|uniref:G-protein coupled receptor 4-like n=1 Tax=Hemibagrus wyckioides TaxID=337641 RepID=UPI00266B4096|nr:G-protein coupled receptor 4-like [Hemibagrus wyckioides]